MEKSKKSCYPQKFRQVWKKDPKLKDWLRENDAIPNKSYCIYCKCDLISKYCDLINHASTKKHLRAAVACSSQQLTDCLPMIKNVAHDIEAKIEYTSNKIEIEPVMQIEDERPRPSKKERISKTLEDSAENYTMEYNESIEQIECVDDVDEEFAESLNLGDHEFETTTTTLQERKLKAEIEYFQQRTAYFAKLTENTKIHKTLMMLQARKLNLEIKKMQNATF